MAVALPTLGVYVGFTISANTGAWTLGTSALGTATILGPSLITTYTNVSADVRSLRIQRGKSDERGQYQAGRCTIALNNRDRDYDPFNLSGPYVTGGVTDVVPGREMYVTATDPTTGTVSRLFTGRTRDWKPSYTGPFDSVVTLEASDALEDLSRADTDAVTTATDIGAVAAQILADVGVTSYAYDDGLFTAQETTWDTSALAALRKLETSATAELYVEANGDIYFTANPALYSVARMRDSQATFGSGNLTFETIDAAYETDQMINSVTLTRTGGAAQTSTDATSIERYGIRSFAQSGLVNSSDTDVLTVATFMKNRFKDPYVRIRGISFHPRKHSDLMTQALTRRLRDRVTVTFSPVGGGSAISQEVFITGIAHEFGPQDMRTSFTFESTDWAEGWVLGYDVLGTGTALGIY